MHYYCWNFHFCIPTLALQTRTQTLAEKFQFVRKIEGSPYEEQIYNWGGGRNPPCLDQIQRKHYLVQNPGVWGLWENAEFCQRLLFAEVPTPPQSVLGFSISSLNPAAATPKQVCHIPLIPHFTKHKVKRQQTDLPN